MHLTGDFDFVIEAGDPGVLWKAWMGSNLSPVSTT